MALFWRCYKIVYGNTFFFLLIYFSVVEDFQLPKTASYVISLPLTMEFIRNFNQSLLCSTLIVSLMMFCVRLLWNCSDETALNSSFHKPSDLQKAYRDSIWDVFSSKKYENAIPKISENAIMHWIIYWYLENYSIFTS